MDRIKKVNVLMALTASRILQSKENTFTQRKIGAVQKNKQNIKGDRSERDLRQLSQLLVWERVRMVEHLRLFNPFELLSKFADEEEPNVRIKNKDSKKDPI